MGWMEDSLDYYRCSSMTVEGMMSFDASASDKQPC